MMLLPFTSRSSSHDGDVALELRGELHDLRRGPRVQAVLVHDLHGAFGHQRTTEKRAKAASRPSGEPPSFDAALQADEHERRRARRRRARRRADCRPGPMMRPQRERNRDARRRAPPACAMCCGPCRSTGLPSADATRSPCVQPVSQPPDAQREVAGVVQRRGRARRPRTVPAPKPNAASAASEQNGSQPAQTSRSPTLPSGPQSAVRKRSIAPAARRSSSARASAPTATDGEIRMRVEVAALARERRAVRRRVHPPGSSRNAGSTQKPMPLPSSVS